MLGLVPSSVIAPLSYPTLEGVNRRAEESVRFRVIPPFLPFADTCNTLANVSTPPLLLFHDHLTTSHRRIIASSSLPLLYDCHATHHKDS